MGIVCCYSEENLIADQESDDGLSEAGAEACQNNLAVLESHSEQSLGSNLDDCSAACLHLLFRFL